MNKSKNTQKTISKRPKPTGKRKPSESMTRKKKTKNFPIKLSTALVAQPKPAILTNHGHAGNKIVHLSKHKRVENRMGDSITWIKNNTQASMFEEYIATMEDPFTYGPVRMGFGTMVPTNCATVYVRGTAVCNGDGSLAFYFLPANSAGGTSQIRGGLYLSNAGANTATWTELPWQNYNNVQLLGDESRIVSGGVRVVPLQAATSAPGIIYAGSISSASNSQLGTLTPNAIALNPFVEWAVSSSGAEVLTRPCDLDAMNFTNVNQFGYGNDQLSINSCGIISVLGMTGAAKVAFEAVLNVEILPDQAFTSASYVGEEKTALLPGLSDFIPSVDSLWSAARRILHDPVILEVATALGATGISSLASRYSTKPYHKRGLKKILKTPSHAAYVDNCVSLQSVFPSSATVEVVESENEDEVFVQGDDSPLSKSTVLARAISKLARS